MKQSVVNLDITPNPDGYTIGGGTIERRLNVSGSDITFIGTPSGSTLTISSSNTNIILIGSGSSTATFPSASIYTLAATNIFQVWSALQIFNGSGSFQYTDTNQAAGFVLMSDANGVGTWVSASFGGGTSGTSGTSGFSGTSGTSGFSGTSGGDGLSGTSGTSGFSGTSGTSGTSGQNGQSGTSGL